MKNNSFQLGCIAATAWSAVIITAQAGELTPPVTVTPELRLHNAVSRDQDDMCVWIHPLDPSLSLIITADKEAGRVFVYDLTGRTLQTLDVPEPGNIDVRQNLNIGGSNRSLVVCNQRETPLRVRVFKVDPHTRTLSSVDDGQITTQANYGGCLYHSRKSGRLYFISTTKENGISQYELFAGGNGQISGKLVREWSLGKSEGAVADDAAGVLYIGEEERGIWRVGAEPDQSTPGELVVRIGEHGLKGDIEGLALATVDSQRLLLLSDQGRSCFQVLARDQGYRLLGQFTCHGADSTDGIEVVDTPLGPTFPQGLFCCHTDIGNRPTLVSSWQTIRSALKPAAP